MKKSLLVGVWKMSRYKMFKFDIKIVFILILAITLLLTLLFRPSKEVDTHREKILMLETKNKKLMEYNDSLTTVNMGLEKDVVILEENVNEIVIELESSVVEIEKLKRKRNEIPTNVIIMDANDVTSNITEYLKRRN